MSLNLSGIKLRITFTNVATTISREARMKIYLDSSRWFLCLLFHFPNNKIQQKILQFRITVVFKHVRHISFLVWNVNYVKDLRKSDFKISRGGSPSLKMFRFLQSVFTYVYNLFIIFCLHFLEWNSTIVFDYINRRATSRNFIKVYILRLDILCIYDIT